MSIHRLVEEYKSAAVERSDTFDGGRSAPLEENPRREEGVRVRDPEG
jgi:hypothetical protein